jgi:hypothetical protein
LVQPPCYQTAPKAPLPTGEKYFKIFKVFCLNIYIIATYFFIFNFKMARTPTNENHVEADTTVWQDASWSDVCTSSFFEDEFSAVRLHSDHSYSSCYTVPEASLPGFSPEGLANTNLDPPLDWDVNDFLFIDSTTSEAEFIEPPRHAPESSLLNSERPNVLQPSLNDNFALSQQQEQDTSFIPRTTPSIVQQPQPRRQYNLATILKPLAPKPSTRNSSDVNQVLPVDPITNQIFMPRSIQLSSRQSNATTPSASSSKIIKSKRNKKKEYASVPGTFCLQFALETGQTENSVTETRAKMVCLRCRLNKEKVSFQAPLGNALLTSFKQSVLVAFHAQTAKNFWQVAQIDEAVDSCKSPLVSPRSLEK